MEVVIVSTGLIAGIFLVSLLQVSVVDGNLEQGAFMSSSPLLTMPSTANLSYDWAVGGYTNVIGKSDYGALWDNGFSAVKLGNYTVSYMVNVPVNVSGYLNVSLLSPFFNFFVPPPTPVTVNWMWIQDGVIYMDNGSVMPDINIWFVPNAPIYDGVIYLIYGGMELSHNGPYNETVFYSNGQWVIEINGHKIATVGDKGVQMKIHGEELIATDVFGITWPYSLVSGFSVKIDSFSTETNDVLPSAGVEVHSASASQFTNDNPDFVATFKFYVNNDLEHLYYANSSSLSADYGYMAGASAPPQTVYGSSLGYINLIGTKAGISSVSSNALAYLTQMPGTEF
ncbi:hypothetical protein [Sulfuracidifex tepidarius]|nr:hypothetical protein [Sulfuracidifex tepidarius]